MIAKINDKNQSQLGQECKLSLYRTIMILYTGIVRSSPSAVSHVLSLECHGDMLRPPPIGDPEAKPDKNALMSAGQ